MSRITCLGVVLGVLGVGACGVDESDSPQQSEPQKNPETQIISGPLEQTAEQSATFEFESSVEDVKFNCRIDGAPSVKCTSPFTQENLEEGQHFFEVRAVTVAGLEETIPAQWSWEIDLTAPLSIVTSAHATLTNQITQTFEFRSEEQTAIFECTLNNLEWNSCASPLTLEGVEGENTWQVRAVDHLGNIETTPASVSWTLDTQPPTSSFQSQPQAYSSMQNVSFSVTSDEAVASYECQLDNEAFSCGSQFDIQDLNHGSHQLELWATDLAGNRQASGLLATWDTDIVAATTTISNAPPAVTNSSVAIFQFSFSEEASLFCSLDENSFSLCDATYSTAALLPGTHQLKYYTEDSAGNVSATQEFTWVIDQERPISQWLQTPLEISKDTESVFAFEANENATFYCSLDEEVSVNCESPYTVSMLSHGTHWFKVYAIDIAGNTELEPISFTWNVDVQPPELVWSGPDAVENTDEASFTASHTDVVVFECILDEVVIEECGESFQVQSLSEGTHLMQMRGRDEAGNWSSYTEIEWVVDLTAPILSMNTEPGDFISEPELSFDFSSETDAVFFCRLNDTAYALCESPWATGSLLDGAHSFDVYSQDLAGNNSQVHNVMWTVDTQAPIISFTLTPDLIHVGNSVTFEIAVVDATSVSYECLFQSDFWSSCTAPFLLSELVASTYTFEIRATDSAGNLGNELSFSWEQNNRPETSFIEMVSGIVDATEVIFSFSSNETGATFECQKDDGLYFDCESPYNWGGLTNGQHQFRVVATDADGAIDLTPAQDSFFVELCNNGEDNVGEVCDHNILCTDENPLEYASGTVQCLNQCSEKDVSACVHLPFSLANLSTSFATSTGTVDQMEEIQITAGGQPEILILYHAGTRARYLELSAPNTPELSTLFDESGSMAHAWVSDLQSNGTHDVIYSSSDNLSDGNYEFYRAENFAGNVSISSFGNTVQGHQVGLMGQYISGGGSEFIFLSSKKVHAIEESSNTLILHEEGLTAVGIANVISPADSATEVIIFSDLTKGFYFYQNSTGGSNMVHGQGLATESTVTEIAVGDFNADGLIDILAASEDEGVFILYNDGGVGFNVDKATLISNAHHLEVFDVDLDDDLDFGFWSPNTETVYWTENLGAGQWQTHTLRTFSNMSDAIFIDIDGDGDQDLITSHETGTLYQLENRSDSIN